MAKSSWEHFEHGADIGIRGIADTKAGAFEQAALSLTAVITDPAGVSAQQMVQIACEAEDDELLLVDWLNALIYEMAQRSMLFGRFEVELHDRRLQAKAWGEKIDIGKHQPIVETKGATYTELKVQQDSHGNWLAQCIVDV